ncbi:hypothetical protein, partial [Nocardia mangyaensis]|uniref:hypothetical protein n=1 Tax=Nocardia mangyaensis TaxID=2213200 RepID=UPI0026765D1A
IMKTVPGMMATERQKNSEKGKEKRSVRNFDEKKKQKFQDDVSKAIGSARKTKTWIDSESAISEMPTLRVLLDDAKNKGGQSLAMLGPKIARSIANEVGVLTEKDVTRYVKNPALVQGLMDMKDKWVAGKLSDVSYENLSRLLDVVEEEAKRKRYAAIEREGKLFSRRENIPLEEAMYYLNEESNKPADRLVTVRRKSDGVTKKMQLGNAEKYRNSDKYEVME